MLYFVVFRFVAISIHLIIDPLSKERHVSVDAGELIITTDSPRHNTYKGEKNAEKNEKKE